MAEVFVKVTGGARKSEEADTIGELKEQLELENYTATVNGEEADDDHELEDDDIVALAKAVKGGC